MGMTKMMTTNEVQKRLDTFPAFMSTKGLREPKAGFNINANESLTASFHWKDEKKTYGTAYEFFRDGTPAQILDAMEAWIAALPSAEETRRNDFMAALGKVIDLGRETGIEVDFVNPLVETMKRLSENAITDQRLAA